MYLVRLFAFVVAARCRFCHCLLLMVFVEEVTLEHRLSSWILQVDLIFFNGIGVFPLLVVNVIFIKVIIVITWLEIRLKSSFSQ